MQYSISLGLIEPEKEVVKLEKKRTMLSASVDKLTKAMKAENYTTKVPPEVREKEKEKLANTEVEILRLGDAIKALKMM